METVSNVASSLHGAVDRILEMLQQRRQRLHAIPASEITLKKVATDPHATVELTPEQVERAREIESAAETTAQEAEPVA
jgi:hypothetical protein